MSRAERDQFERLQAELSSLEQGVAALDAALLDTTRQAHALEADLARRAPELAQLEQDNRSVELEISRLEGTYTKIRNAPLYPELPSGARLSGRTGAVILGAIGLVVALLWLMGRGHT